MSISRNAICLLLLLVATQPSDLFAQQLPGAQRIASRYQKEETMIEMRDGVKLHTVIYAPRDKSKKYPIMLKRTCYSVGPYGPNNYASRIGPSAIMEDAGYIFVHQDVRGRFMSEGSFDNMRPNVDDEKIVDESSDTYDTIDWLVKRIRNNNGKVGMWGISYPGFYCAAALPDHHPALVASAPQAPISDFFFDDFHHHGAFLLSYLSAINTFGYQHTGPTQQKWYPEIDKGDVSNGWQFYMNLGALKNVDRLFEPKNEFWKQIKENPNYNKFWQDRSIPKHLKNIKTNVLIVGGFYDAEDLYGPLNIYRSIEKNNDNFNAIVMGPWEHGEWARRGTGDQIYTVGKLGIDKGLQAFYQRKLEAPFFAHFLKGEGKRPKYEAVMYDTGLRRWRKFSKWPPEKSIGVKSYLRAGGQLAGNGPKADAEEDEAYSEFVSDPKNPVPYRKKEDITVRFSPREFMTDDQRFASSRPDVLVFKTQPLKKSITLTGDLTAHLKVSTSKTAADWIVKLIDVFPDDHPFVPGSQPDQNFAGFEGLVRSETIRGRFRNSYEKPEPFEPNKVTDVDLPLQDVCYTFKRGHRIMIHVQSTMFPYIDRNPQKYVSNIFEAEDSDFVSATHRVYHNAENASWIEMQMLDKSAGK